MTVQARRMILHPASPGDCQVKGVVFDMDGTLTKPQSYMFDEMRRALGIMGKPVDILSHMASLRGAEREKAERKVKEIEHQAMLCMKPQEGLKDLFIFLRAHPDVKFTICTRNLIDSVDYLLAHFLKGIELDDPIVTRTFVPPKPSPKPILHIARSWGIDPQNLIMVGDSRDDMFSGLRADCSLVLMRHKDNHHIVNEIPEIDYVIDDFHQLIRILQTGFEATPKAPRELRNFSGY